MTYKYRLCLVCKLNGELHRKQLSFSITVIGKYIFTIKKPIINTVIESKTKEIVLYIGEISGKNMVQAYGILLLAGGVWTFITYRIRKIKRKEKEKPNKYA